jgi:hypothetical protein
MTKQQLIIKEKLQKIINKYKRNTNKKYAEKNAEIYQAIIKNMTHAFASYGAQEGRFIGMITLTFGKNEYERILPTDYLSVIERKTKIMADSILYYIDKLKKALSKRNFKLIYIGAFELQKDGNLHAHIFFSLDIKAFAILFKFFHNYSTSIVTKKKEVKLNKKTRTVIPIGRCQLGIAKQFKSQLEKNGFKFEEHKNRGRIDYRCTKFVSIEEFRKGSWPTLYFYEKEKLKKHYGEKIAKYLSKNYSKKTRQKAIGDNFNKHNFKTIIDNEINEWIEIQKEFIKVVVGRAYFASRLPFPISLYQKFRKKIIKAYDKYRNLDVLIDDLLTEKASFENKILTCPNGIKINFTK